ncbi:hypothetical protein [Halococcus saccharolyticus]|uniref:Uncharacterized protein n=1 Tax=Halococcus saccharolyticus DSM 5350 TaxID=1227455 RepID=M0MDL6_9EURY|nr:hypothetical protein [Halococcus saccharolyticus]EMA42480.1 hypothetical protein C449_17197 [Halococcus saccharolyticus DSM 5350]
MALLSLLAPIGALANAAIAALVVGFVIVLGYRRVTRTADADTAERPAESTEGPPLESWRHVYDVDKAAADREITAVQEQAADLAEADEEARR